MNKKAIRDFAIWARVNLIEAVSFQAYRYEISEDADENKNMVRGYVLTDDEKAQRKELLLQIKRKGFDQVMEETAYTWFNRFIALRFMEVNGYLPSRVRVFTNEAGEFKPEILKEAMNVEIDGLDRDKVFELLDKQDNEALYKMLIITQCNALNKSLPYMFEKLSNYTEMLFPANLLKAGSVIDRMVTDIPEDDWTNQVQIIGWLYQYYNSELKDDTFALLKKNVKITKERIPAATQLFTPDWIVHYMVENSLGRLWLEGHNDDVLKSEWRYYLDEAKQEEEVQKKLAEIRKNYSELKPEDIKLIDTCMGSGHILVYAFEAFMQIYLSVGWTKREAVKSILENNLYGLDICQRAGQLAYFSVMVTARKYDRRILDKGVKANIYSIDETSEINHEIINYFANGDAELLKAMENLLSIFKDAKEYGSLLNVEPQCWDKLYARYEETQNEVSLYSPNIEEHIKPLIDVARVMSQKYDVVVTNPPYMGNKGMSAKLSKYVLDNFPDSKNDLFACFIEKCSSLLKPIGFLAMITQHSWMFISSFEKLRAKILSKDIVNMVHLGARAFEDIGGEVVQTTSFVTKAIQIPNYKGTYCRLIEPTTQQGKEDMFLSKENRYISAQNNFSKIPGSPVAYWVSSDMLRAFDIGISVDDISDFTGSQHITANNDKYLRTFWEVNFGKIGKKRKWVYYAKGGQYRKWYGNVSYIVDVSGEAMEHYKNCSTANCLDDKYWFQEGITYSAITSKGTGFRYLSAVGGFDKGGATICYVKDICYVLSFLNSIVAMQYLNLLNPTINLQIKDIKSTPIIIDNDYNEATKHIVTETIELSKQDWDSFETSWDFKRHPLV